MPRHRVRQPPRPGRRFKKKYRGREYELEVVRHNNAVWYSLGSRLFRTPSAAARALTGHEINGWKFWKIEAG
jgi:hypothetical protein